MYRWFVVSELIHGENQMVLIVTAVIVLVAAVIIRRMRVPLDVNADHLGWMSEQWLAEHRASHPH